MIVIIINNGPCINIGNSGIKTEGVLGILDDIEINVISEIASTLKIVFARGGN